MKADPDPTSSSDGDLYSKIVEEVLLGYLPDEVRPQAESKRASPPYPARRLDELQIHALRQAGFQAGDIETRILKVEIDQLRREIDRLERITEAQGNEMITEGKVYSIAFGALFALVGMVTLMGFISGTF
jgi:hypothetical protein